MTRLARPGLLGVLCGFSAASAPWAAGVTSSFDLPPRPPAQAALAVALKAGITLGVTVSCKGPAVAVRGRMNVRTALDLALADSDCQAVWIDGLTARIERRPRAAKATAPASRPQVEPAAANAAEVVVTASKRGLEAFDLPGSVSVVQAPALSAVRASDTADLRLLASGMTVTNLGPGRDKVLLRGLSDGAFTGHTQSTVGLYWNQTPTTYNAPDPDLRLVDVQSVEVLRGPQGTLYGAGAIGGVVSVTPVAPDPSRTSGFVSATAAATASGDPSAGTEAMFNLPLAGGKAALRLVAYGEEDGGYIDLPRLGVQNANHTQETGLRAAVRAEPRTDWSVTLGDIYQDIYSDDTQYTTGDPAALQRDTLVREPHDNDFEQVYLDVRGRGGWGDLHSIASFIDHEFDSRYDASNAAPDFGGPPAPTAFDDDTLVRLTSEELDYRAPVHGPASLLVGGYGSYGDEHETTRLGPTGAGPELYAEDRTDRMMDLTLFGEGSYALTSRLSATLGLRLAYAERRTLSRVDEGGAQAPFSGRYTTKEWAPKLALDYALIDGVRLYALASKGYRVGGFNTAGPLSTAFMAQGGAEPNRSYLPDDLWNYEAGAKLQGWNGRLQARTALYYDVWYRLQADQLLPSGLSYVANVGDAHVKGWEWEASARPLPRLTLDIGALFTAPDLRKVDPSFPAGQSDFTLPGVARRSINSRMQYDLPLGGGRSLELAAAALYVGHSYLFFGPQGSSEMGHYLDGRLQAVFQTPHVSLGLLISNPANNRGDTFAFGNPFSLSAAPQATPLRPRTVRLTLTRDF